MGMAKEFREFISRGNVMDLAVGIIIGAAFTDIVKKLVDAVIMPIVSLVLPAGDWRTEFKIDLGNGKAILIGEFLSSVLNFLIIAFVVFLMVKGLNKLRRKEEAKAAS